MRITTGSVLGIVGVLAPLVFIGAFLRYFMGVGGDSFEGVVGIGLGPTVLGLAGVGLFFMVPVIVKLLRLTGGAGPKPGARAAEPPTETEGFDADAALANYMRHRAEEPGAGPAASRSDEPRPFGNPGGFGRKTV